MKQSRGNDHATNDFMILWQGALPRREMRRTQKRLAYTLRFAASSESVTGIPRRALLQEAGARIEGPTFEEWLESDILLFRKPEAELSRGRYDGICQEFPSSHSGAICE